MGYDLDMNRLTDIESRVEALTAAEKQELLLFLAAQLRLHAGPLPAPRRFSADQIQAWIAEDEADMSPPSGKSL